MSSSFMPEPSPTQEPVGIAQPLTPKIEALREALRKLDAQSPWGREAAQARDELLKVAREAGFDPKRCVEDWARYTVAVAETVTEVPEDACVQTALALGDDGRTSRKRPGQSPRGTI